ncbi:MAG: DUF2335 domain-containing protein [Candidatus Thiosymbion ectosymbiont of Robbea hypermnestra]|nr:DUF2335 domain-containing protein [Candidatus Thiosymbion ectosymbiont of Robbea hypermnestra]
MKGDELATDLEETAKEIQGEVAVIRTSFTGPLPLPDILQKYDQVLPGLTDRIVRMAEAEGNHRRTQESQALEAEIENDHKLVDAYIKEVRIGQQFAFVIAVVALCLGSYVAVNGGEFAGAVIGAGGLIGIVTAFIQGRRKNGSAEEPASSRGTAGNE